MGSPPSISPTTEGDLENLCRAACSPDTLYRPCRCAQPRTSVELVEAERRAAERANTYLLGVDERIYHEATKGLGAGYKRPAPDVGSSGVAVPADEGVEEETGKTGSAKEAGQPGRGRKKSSSAMHDSTLRHRTSHHRAWGYCSVMPGGAALKRAWRRLTLEHHPDKGGSSEHFQALTQHREGLSSVLQWSLRGLFREGVRQDPDRALAGFIVSTAEATVFDKGGWPYLQLDIEIDSPQAEPLAGGVWTMGIEAEGVSVIEYKGDELVGGYDVCCDLLHDTRCKRTPLKAGGLTREPYLRHDCPIVWPLRASITKPLHVDHAGRWGATVALWDLEGNLIACVVVPFEYHHIETFDPEPGPEPPRLGRGSRPWPIGG